MNDAIDLYARQTQTFPRLSGEMTLRAATYGTQEPVSTGEFLSECGQRHVDFFLVVLGQIEILEPTAEGGFKRVPSGVGEGSVAVQAVHRVLNQ